MDWYASQSITMPLKLTWACVITGEIFMYGVFPILVNLSKTGDNISFLSASFNFHTEALKFVICLVVVCVESYRNSVPQVSWRTALLFSIPAALYCINNNLAVLMQTQMDPATYMVLGHLKILSTAALYKLFFKRAFTANQMLAMVLLMFGGVLNSVSALTTKDTTSVSEIHITWLGLLALFFYCFISAFSGVYTEYIFKKDDNLSVYFQNAILYTFGMLFNFLSWLIQAQNKVKATGNNEALNPFYGFTVFTWALIFTQAPTGLIMSLIMKYKSNIVRLFIIASAPLVTTALSSLLFGLKISAEFVISAVFILTAAIIYNNEEKAASKNVSQQSLPKF